MYRIFNSLQKVIYKRIAFIILLLFYTSGILYLSFEINIWEDEAYSLNTSSGNLSYAISQSYKFEGQPPVYFSLLSLWRTINPGIFFARLLSILFIGMAAFVIHRIVLLFTDNDTSRWIVVLFLLNPFTVWSALEIRTYSLLILLSSVSLYFFLKYFFDNKNKYLYFFLIVCLTGLYTQYFFVFLIISFSIIILIYKGWKSFFTFCLHFIPVVILFLPNLIFLPDQLEMAQADRPNYSRIRSFISVLRAPQDLFLALQILPFEALVKWGVRFIFGAIVGIAYFRLNKNSLENNSSRFFNMVNLFFLSIFILVLLFSIFVPLFGIWYEIKYFAVAFPFFALFLTIFNKYPFGYRKLIFAGISLYYIFLLALNYIPPIKDYDYKSIAKYIEMIERKGEPILIYSSLIELPFSAYYDGSNAVAPLPHATEFNQNYIKNIKDTIEFKNTINKIIPSNTSFLFISDDITTYAMSLFMNRGLIDIFLNNNFHNTLDTLFYGKSDNRYLRIRRFETTKYK